MLHQWRVEEVNCNAQQTGVAKGRTVLKGIETNIKKFSSFNLSKNNNYLQILTSLSAFSANKKAV